VQARALLQDWRGLLVRIRFTPIVEADRWAA